jgi:kinesin family protein 4/21/27
MCLQMHPYSSEQLAAALDSVISGSCTMASAVGPAVGCLMATFATSLITDCIFDFEDPEELSEVVLGQRLELWGLQASHIE